ncbi:MAG: prolipoprotein diacylglyceryl transferase [Bacillota bacterium]|nr:prolipoprotein diacylglyceryl transferase [Bacillota bacterium]
MLPFIHLFGHDVATWGLVIAAAFLLGAAVAVLLSRRLGASVEDSFYALLYACIGVLIGGKLLYLLTSIPLLCSLLQSGVSLRALIPQLARGGFVLYGGIAGGLAGIWIYARQFRLAPWPLARPLIAVIPLLQGLGRLGCFAAGCCYGRRCEQGIVFTVSPVAPNHVPLIPTQLIEAAVGLVIFVIILRFTLKGMGARRLLAVYLLLYGSARFLIEFLRGDPERGFLFGLSTSQWLSLAALLIAVRLLAGSGYRKSADSGGEGGGQAAEDGRS